MAGPGNAAPVIIKREKNVVGGGHHGGAWKVAYADFVTAMMAFFLLMWLLNATTDKPCNYPQVSGCSFAMRAPSRRSARRDKPRQMTVVPGGGSDVLSR